jgi:hypothetical protein
MAAPAETRTPNLHRARNAHIECGWKGGVSLSSARKTGSGCERRTTFCFSLARQDSIRPAAAAVKALRYAPTAVAARPKRAVLTAVLAGQNHATIRAREKQKVMNDPNHLTSTGLLMEVLKSAHVRRISRFAHDPTSHVSTCQDRGNAVWPSMRRPVAVKLFEVW